MVSTHSYILHTFWIQNMYFETLLTRGCNPNLCCSPTQKTVESKEKRALSTRSFKRVISPRKLYNVTLIVPFSQRDFNLSDFWRPPDHQTHTSHSVSLSRLILPRDWRRRANLKGPTRRSEHVDVRGTTKLSAARTALQGNQGGPRTYPSSPGTTHWRNTPLDVSL